MTEGTHFIDYDSGAWVKGINQLVPNLREGQFLYIMKDKADGYQTRKYKIHQIETFIGDTTDIILQDVTVIDLGIVAEVRNGKEDGV